MSCKLVALMLLTLSSISFAATDNLMNTDVEFTSTFLGGGGEEDATRSSIARDADGNIFIVGRTTSSDFPWTTGAYDSSYNGAGDIFISKFSPDLSTLIASTYFGSSGQEYTMRNTSLLIDPEGNVYITGQAAYTGDFPYTPNAYDTSYNGGSDAFIAKLSNDLSTLLAATLFGTAGYEESNSIAMDQDGNVFIAGYTRYPDFPTTPNAYDSVYHGTGTMQWGGDLYVAKFTNDLSDLLACTLLGGNDWDEGSYMAIDDNGKVIITGSTNSSDFPIEGNPYDDLFHGGSYGGDIYLSKLSNDLTTLEASTFIGGYANDWAYSIALDNSGSIYITGHIPSPDFPYTSGAYDTTYSGIGGTDVGDDVFVSKFSNDLSTLLASTFLGAAGHENGNAVAVDNDGFVYVGGTTGSAEFDVIPGSYDTLFNGGSFQYGGDGYVAKFDGDLNTLIASSFLGGIGQDAVLALAVDDNGNVYASGFTNSYNFPASPEAYDTLYGGGAVDQWGGDAFLAMFPKEYLIDTDNDAVVDAGDNCRINPNADQADVDEDGVGDVCDNCPNDFNPGQEDANQDGIGDVCAWLCGDSDATGALNILDVTYIINYLYKSGPAPDPIEAADADGSGMINLLDVTFLINYLYKSGPEPLC